MACIAKGEKKKRKQAGRARGRGGKRKGGEAPATIGRWSFKKGGALFLRRKGEKKGEDENSEMGKGKKRGGEGVVVLGLFGLGRELGIPEGERKKKRGSAINTTTKKVIKGGKRNNLEIVAGRGGKRGEGGKERGLAVAPGPTWGKKKKGPEEETASRKRGGKKGKGQRSRASPSPIKRKGTPRPNAFERKKRSPSEGNGEGEEANEEIGGPYYLPRKETPASLTKQRSITFFAESAKEKILMLVLPEKETRKETS